MRCCSRLHVTSDTFSSVRFLCLLQTCEYTVFSQESWISFSSTQVKTTILCRRIDLETCNMVNATIRSSGARHRKFKDATWVSRCEWSPVFSLSVSNGTVPAPVSLLSASPATVSASRSGSSSRTGGWRWSLQQRDDRKRGKKSDGESHATKVYSWSQTGD